VADELNEIWTLYADDGGQSLDQVEEALLALKHNPSDAQAIGLLFRAMHTFKGNSRILGLAVSESRAHLAEDLIGLVRDDGVPLDEEMQGLLLQTADALRGMLEVTLRTHKDDTEAETADLAARLHDKIQRCKGAAPAGGAAIPAHEEEAPASIIFDIPESVPEPAQEEVPADITAAAEDADEPLREAIIFEPQGDAGFGGDAVYLEIFRDMSFEVTASMRAALGQFETAPDDARAALAQLAERLNYAAGLIKASNWQSVLQQFTDETLTREQAETLFGCLEELQGGGLHRERADAASQPEDQIIEFCPAGMTTLETIEACGDAGAFFAALDPLLAEMSQLHPWNTSIIEMEPDQIARIAAAIRDTAAGHGFASVAAIAAQFDGVRAQPQELSELQFQLLDELSLIEKAVYSEGAVAAGGADHPMLAMLRAWCAMRVTEAIELLKSALNSMRLMLPCYESCRRLRASLHQIHHACEHYRIETASHLAMALVDLFYRDTTTEGCVDPVLMHVLKSFIRSMEVVFSATAKGHTPDMKDVEALLQEAENVPFTSSGTVPASAIEACLGLPKKFHKVLTPESVKTAVSCLESGHDFYIVAADINEHEDLAVGFLTWIQDGGATIITNVTRFEGDQTAYDFLLASPLGEAAFAEALASLDPDGRGLRLEAVLTERKDKQRAGGKETGGVRESASAAAAAQDIMSRGMLESIGEIVTGHALARHMLASFAGEDPAQIVEAEVRAAGGDWNNAREAVRARLRDWQERIEKLLQVEAQLAGRLDRLQEEAIAVRTRPAGLLLKPIVAYGETLARDKLRQVAITTAGDDVALDFSMLENFKTPLRSLVTFAATESVEPRETREGTGKHECGHVHIAVVRREDHVSITVEDDGAGFAAPRLEERVRSLGWTDARIGPDIVLRDGFGKFSNTGDSEGIDFAEVRRALRIGGGDLRISSLPSGGLRFYATLPLAMVVLDGMVVRAGEVMYVVPIDSIQLIVHPASSALMRVSAGEGGYMLKLSKDDVLPVRFLTHNGGESGNFDDHQFAGSGTESEDDTQKCLFVVAGNQTQRVALSIDELIGQQLVLIRPLQGYLSGIRGVTGCALLGSGGVGMVLDMGYVLNQSGTALN
jgi:two-component system chemotaxis sensor kinase CheA